jgi:F-type H+/Na+-transporting ATPase subunit alpha
VHPELISTAIRARLGSSEAAADLSEVGRVISIGDGIARVSGVEGAMLEFPADFLGMALNTAPS